MGRKNVRRYNTTWLCGFTQLSGCLKSSKVQLKSKDWNDVVNNLLHDWMIWDGIQAALQVNNSGINWLYTPNCYVHQWAPSMYPTSLYIRTPSVSLSSAKLSSGCGEKLIFQPQRSIWYSRLAEWKRFIQWLVHNLWSSIVANIQFADESSPLSALKSEDEDCKKGTHFLLIVII